MNKVLEVSNLNKRYGSFSLQDVSFEVPKGYVMGFIGPNGAGKTTVIKSILRMIRYASGDIKLFGHDAKACAGRINERIGVVMDAPFYAEDWTAADVEAALSPFYPRWSEQTYASLLSRFEIDKQKKVKDLSRGMKVKLMTAVALSHAADLLILDEPTSGLDPVARDELCDILGEFVADENKSVLFSTHITADLEKMADYITFILGGRIVFTGQRENLLEKYALIKGAPRAFDAEHRKWMIGLREHGTGFEAMAETSNLERLPKSILVDPVTLEEVIIFMNREAKRHE